MQTLTQRRSVPVDAAKTAAIFGTLLIHASAAGGFAGAPGSFGWTSALFWNCLLRSAVPVFFLCSGALLLPPAYSTVLMLLLILLDAVFSTVYSYQVYQKYGRN